MRFAIPRDVRPVLLVGPNGSGKTTALSTLALVSAGSLAKAFDTCATHVALGFEDGSEVRIEPLGAGGSMSVSVRQDDSAWRVFELVALDVNAEVLSQAQESDSALSSEEPDRTSHTDSGDAPSEAQLQSLLAGGDSVRFSPGPLSFAFAGTIAGDLIEGAPMRFMGASRVGLPAVRRFLSGELDVPDTVPACRVDLQCRLLREQEPAQAHSDDIPLVSRVDLLRDTATPYLGADAVDAFLAGRPTDALSSGQRHLLVLFYGVLFAMPPRCVILIDEPELSLHISWQITIVEDLLTLAAARDSRIVLATHSADLVNDWYGDVVELVDVVEP